MSPLPALNAEFQRAIILLLPFILSGAAVLITYPHKRVLAGAFLASMWNFLTLIPVNILAIHMGWWSFAGDKHLVMDLPFDVILGWSVFWGGAVFLGLHTRHIIWALALVLWLDLLFMPRLAPLVKLGQDWLWGEALVLMVCFIPSWIIGTLTKRDTHVGWRATAQAVMTALLFMVLLPSVLLEYDGRGLMEILKKPMWEISIILNILLFPVILGLAGNQEFAERGDGTPIPFDPPKHLVVTGPYAFVANPMQLSVCLSLATLAVSYGSWLIAISAIVSVIYCLGFVRWHHTIDVEPRFGEAWFEYRRNVHDWLPRWKPWVGNPSTVYFARHCGICQDTEHWVRRFNPIGLSIEDAAIHPQTLDRVTYRYPDGREVQGIYAIASCMNHINFAFAFLGWFMRLPIIRQFLQIVIDGTGERATAI